MKNKIFVLIFCLGFSCLTVAAYDVHRNITEHAAKSVQDFTSAYKMFSEVISDDLLLGADVDAMKVGSKEVSPSLDAKRTKD